MGPFDCRDDCRILLGVRPPSRERFVVVARCRMRPGVVVDHGYRTTHCKICRQSTICGSAPFAVHFGTCKGTRTERGWCPDMHRVDMEVLPPTLAGLARDPARPCSLQQGWTHGLVQREATSFQEGVTPCPVHPSVVKPRTTDTRLVLSQTSLAIRMASGHLHPALRKRVRRVVQEPAIPAKPTPVDWVQSVGRGCHR